MRKAAAEAIAVLVAGAVALTAAGAQEDTNRQRPSAANAQAAPAPAGPICTARVEGQVSCQGNRLCECVRANAVPARDLPARWRWDCSIKRPRCTVTPERLAPHDSHGHYPTEVEIDRGGDNEDGAPGDGSGG